MRSPQNLPKSSNWYSRLKRSTLVDLGRAAEPTVQWNRLVFPSPLHPCLYLSVWIYYYYIISGDG
jgi:hypothetical protein